MDLKSNDDFSFLLAGKEDVKALNLLVNSAYRGDESKKGWTTEADLLDGIRIDEDRLLALIKKTDSFIIKAIKSGQILGCVHLEKHDNKCYLGMLTVSPQLQNSGLGKKLLEFSEGYGFSQLKCSKIYMTVISIRTELLDWYKRRGYQPTGEIKPFPMDDPRFGIPKTQLEFIVLDKSLNS